jgi:hypothetical protein
MVNSKNVGKTIKLVIGIVVFGYAFFWCVYNLEAFVGFTAWARPELYGPDGEAWYAKFYGIRAILAYMHSPLNWLLGLGPGHTISRLGGWFIKDYWSLLGPLGATIHPVTTEVLDFTRSYWLVYSSSFFSPIFGWSGLWGDLGLLGIGAYLFLAYLVWQHFGLDDSLKVTLLAVLVLGFIFTQLEEPGFMLSIAFMLGLPWQERQLRKQAKNTFNERSNQLTMPEIAKDFNA